MSNAAYIAYLQTVVAANAALISTNSSTEAALGQAILDAEAQAAALSVQRNDLQTASGQLAASNVLVANLIAQLQAAK